MRRRRFLASSIFVTAILRSPTRALAQDERNVYADAVRWFKAMFRPLDELADLIDRNRILSFLTNLGSALEAMLRDKRQIAVLIRSRPVPRDQLRAVAQRLMENVLVSSDRVTQVAFLLKQQYREQGERIASGLSVTLLQRKSWVAGLADRIGSISQDELEGISHEAEASSAALAEATSELARLVAFIRGQT